MGQRRQNVVKERRPEPAEPSEANREGDIGLKMSHSDCPDQENANAPLTP